MSNKKDDITLGPYDGPVQNKGSRKEISCNGLKMVITSTQYGIQPEYFVDDVRVDKEVYLNWLRTLEIWAKLRRD